MLADPRQRRRCARQPSAPSIYLLLTRGAGGAPHCGCSRAPWAQSGAWPRRRQGGCPPRVVQVGGGEVPSAPAGERADSVPGPQFKIMLFGCLSPRQRTSRCRRRGRLRVGQPSRGAGHPLYPAARREHPRPHPAAAAVDSTSLVTGDHAPQHLPPAAAAAGPSMSGFCRVRHCNHPSSVGLQTQSPCALREGARTLLDPRDDAPPPIRTECDVTRCAGSRRAREAACGPRGEGGLGRTAPATKTKGDQ